MRCGATRSRAATATAWSSWATPATAYTWPSWPLTTRQRSDAPWLPEQFFCGTPHPLWLPQVRGAAGPPGRTVALAVVTTGRGRQELRPCRATPPVGHAVADGWARAVRSHGRRRRPGCRLRARAAPCRSADCCEPVDADDAADDHDEHDDHHRSCHDVDDGTRVRDRRRLLAARGPPRGAVAGERGVLGPGRLRTGGVRRHR